MTHTSAPNMRTRILTCALALTALASASHVLAQSQTLKVDIPFAFENGSQHLPSGTYSIRLNSDHPVLLRSADGRGAGFAMAYPEQKSKPSQTSSVVFHRYGNRYFLGEIWTADSTTGLRIVKSHAEKQVQVARNEPAPTNIELALNAAPR